MESDKLTSGQAISTDPEHRCDGQQYFTPEEPEDK